MFAHALKSGKECGQVFAWIFVIKANQMLCRAFFYGHR